MPANAPSGYIDIPLDRPAEGVTPSGQKYTYSPNDASIGDVDGDGEYAGRALAKHSNLTAAEIAKEALTIAADICVYTNHNIIVEELDK